MNIKPILYSASMIRALLDGRKTQTRRLKFKCEPGDLLWVKETYCPYLDEGDWPAIDYRATPRWEASHPAGWHESPDDPEALKWKPSIFMPRKYSRLTQEVTAVRKEQLQDISEQDAIAEGLSCLSKDGGLTYKYGIPDRDGLPGNDDDGWNWQEWMSDPVSAYAKLWESINGRGSWEANPEIDVVSFKTHKMNIDQFLKQKEAA